MTSLDPPGWSDTRELDYGITDEWDGLEDYHHECLMEDARDDRYELSGESTYCIEIGLFNHHLAVMVEREAWMAREAWGNYLWTLGRLLGSHVLALRNYGSERVALIFWDYSSRTTETRSVDYGTKAG
ncbi:hypothetical protein Tco_0573049 [Tanacetum coccineum]